MIDGRFVRARVQHRTKPDAHRPIALYEAIRDRNGVLKTRKEEPLLQYEPFDLVVPHG